MIWIFLVLLLILCIVALLYLQKINNFVLSKSFANFSTCQENAAALKRETEALIVTNKNLFDAAKEKEQEFKNTEINFVTNNVDFLQHVKNQLNDFKLPECQLCSAQKISNIIENLEGNIFDAFDKKFMSFSYPALITESFTSPVSNFQAISCFVKMNRNSNFHMVYQPYESTLFGYYFSCNRGSISFSFTKTALTFTNLKTEQFYDDEVEEWFHVLVCSGGQNDTFFVNGFAIPRTQENLFSGIGWQKELNTLKVDGNSNVAQLLFWKNSIDLGKFKQNIPQIYQLCLARFPKDIA